MTDPGQSSTRPTPASEAAAKKPYHTPELHVHGELREITRSSGGSTVTADSPQPYVS